MIAQAYRLLFIILAGMLSLSFQARAQDVDLEIVLAVDSSGSISSSELKLQLKGYAAAFRDPTIQKAALSGPLGKIAVALMIWSDAAFPKFPTEWHVIDEPDDALKFADVVENFYERSGRNYGIGGGGTGIGDGVAYAIKMLGENNIAGLRQVIDVSGDGVETDPWFREAVTLPDARKAAELRGVTINGLAILTDFPRLDIWYRKHLVRGPGSFVVVAKEMSNFAEAIRKKLWREFSNQTSELKAPPLLSRFTHNSHNNHWPHVRAEN